MAKKDIKGVGKSSAAAFNAMIGADVQDIQDTQNAENVKAAKPVYARLNLKIPAVYKEYLQAAAYRESGPKKTVSITEYLCGLIQKDMDEHKEG